MNCGRQPRDRSALLAAMHGLVIRTRHAARLVRQERLAVCLRFASALGCPTHGRPRCRYAPRGSELHEEPKQAHYAWQSLAAASTATANALLQRGIDVHLYEQAAALAEVGAGVAIQPNGVRKLRRLGLGDGLIRRGPDGSTHSFVAPMDPTPRRCGPPSSPAKSSSTACTAPICCQCSSTGYLPILLRLATGASAYWRQINPVAAIVRPTPDDR